jgi:glycosyltransferase 2 family protein
MSRKTLMTWGRLVAPVLVLALLVWRLGSGPFLDGVRTIDGRVLVEAVGITALTTVCAAWRWKIVSRGLGIDLSLPSAVAAYYRSLFLNVTLPGGVVGDVHRGIAQGRDARDVGRGLRAVAWERGAGQVVQLVVTVVVLLVLPSPVRSAMPAVAIGAVALALVVALVCRARPGGDQSALARVRTVAGRDIRDGLLSGSAWRGIALASMLVVAGHATTFMIAARTAGSTATVSQMLPIALLAMMGMVLPSVAGWGPREGVTAWAFAAAGLGAQRGVTTAVVYGVMVFVACLPGAIVLVVAWFRRIRLPECSQQLLRESAAHA